MQKTSRQIYRSDTPYDLYVSLLEAFLYKWGILTLILKKFSKVDEYKHKIMSSINGFKGEKTRVQTARWDTLSDLYVHLSKEIRVEIRCLNI